jgi:BMFP domain-containing protein YqiC
MKTLILICVAAMTLVFADVAAAANGNPGAGQLRDIAKQLKEQAADCKKAPAAARKECVEKLIAVLDEARERIGAVEEMIKDRCSATPTATTGSTTGAQATNRCASAEKLVERLEKLKARIDQLEAKLRKGLDAQTSAGSASSSGSSTSTDPNLAAIESALNSLGP